MDIIRHIRDIMTRDRLMFVYRGEVTGDNSIPLLMLLEREMLSSEFAFIGRKRLFMFVLESLQNVSRHSRGSEHAEMSMVVFAKNENGYTITTANVLESSSTASLKQKLEEINSLDTDEIRSIYRQMLGNAEFSTKGGAGLGLIEMAKKTGNRLDYDFVDLGGGFSYFILSKTVGPEGVGYNTKGQDSEYNGNEIMKLEKLMAVNNIYLIWSGHISPDIGKEVLSFTETRMREEELGSGLRKRIFNILVEILENVARYSASVVAEKEFGMPVATLRLDGDTYSITTGNLIEFSGVEGLKEKLDIVNSCDREGLKKMLGDNLTGRSPANSGSGMLGLIEIALKASGRLVYEFEDINESYSYYTLNVRICDRDNQDNTTNLSSAPSQTA
ncbi:MAG: SiaB family protein kinase [Bacteroidales bacterium]|jgi:hypothetical protein|nr:SiaB family protein kinase [Bacteroidales bacterium]